MGTDPDKYYNLRDMRSASAIKEQPLIDGWFGQRKNGKFFLKRWRGNCSEFKGGEALDAFLEKNPDIKAYDVGKKEPIN